MSWNYRVIEFIDPTTGPWQAVFEVYYDKDGAPESYAENPAVVIAEGEADHGIAELGNVLGMMTTALSKPVLVEKDFQITRLANALEEAGVVPSPHHSTTGKE